MIVICNANKQNTSSKEHTNCKRFISVDMVMQSHPSHKFQWMYNQEVSAYGPRFIVSCQSWSNCCMETRAGWKAKVAPNVARIN